MKNFKKKISRLLLITLIFSIIQVQSVKEVKAEGGLSVINATAQELVDKLIGSGITASNIKFTGADTAKGTFSGGNGIVGFDEGAILSSGNASYVVGPNDATNKTAENGQPGDADLTSLAGMATNDAAILEFDFVPTSNVVSFQYAFSSEEYNEYANSNVNDTFAFFINGVNYALIPETSTAVSINTVNGGNPLGTNTKNSQYYINNEDKHLNTQMDGLTAVFSVNAPVNQGVANHIKMAIADGGDSSFDSNVFIKANSINGKIAQPGKLDITSKDNYDITITRSGGSDGTVSATWQALDGSNSVVKTGVVTFGDGETTKIINVPASTVKVKLINPTGGGTIGDSSKEIFFLDIPSSNTPPTTPGAFTAPVLGQTFKGGDSITVTWGVSSDMQNDPISYTLEFNNGDSWTQIYNGPSVSYSFTNTSGLNTTNAQFRVKASDDGGYSDYVTSNIFTVDSQAPQTPVLSASTTAPTNGDVTVTVTYPEDASVKQYRVGTSGAWLNYAASIIVTNNNTVYARCQDTAGNWSDEVNLDINNIDKTSPNAAVIANKDNYTENKWFNELQTITASFTKTEGCDEKLQYKLDDSAWTDGGSLDVNTEGKHAVSFRVIDALGRTSEEQTVNVNIDKTAPTNVKITVKDKEFTSFLNDITFGLFFKETVGVTITADCGISGVSKIEYQKVSDAAAYNPAGTWTEGNSFSVSPNEKFIVYAKITDNAGNFVIINSDGVIVDATLPALELTPDADSWTKNNVSVKVKVSDNLAGVKDVRYTTDEAEPQTGTAVISGGEGTITLTNEGQYKLTVTAKDNSLNEISESINIKIDEAAPVILSITGNAADWTSESVTLAVNANDQLSGLQAEAYSFDGGITWQSSNVKTFDTNTNGIIIKVKDNAGNIADSEPNDITKIDKTSPNAAAIANAENYKVSKWYNSDQTIAASFTKTEGCDEKLQYKSDDSAWTDGESLDVSAEGNHVVSFRVIDALGRTSEEQTVNVNIDRTKPIISGATNSSSYFIGRIIKITDDLGEISEAAYKVGSDAETPFKDGDLFEKPGAYTLKVTDKAGNSSELSFEIKSLPKVTDIVYTNDCKELIDSIRLEFNSHNDLPDPYKTDMDNEIKALEDRYSQLEEEAHRKSMFQDEDTDTTVTGVDGTSFDSDVILVVTPISRATDESGFNAASDNFETASKYISAVKGKELLVLYDVSLFRDNVKIQPDGKVKVKIKIPEGLRNRTGLDIVHIADNGTVTSMNAAIEGEYLVFITDHFSDYAIVANPIAKTMPKTGSPFDFSVLSVIGLVSILGGLLLLTIRRKEQ